MHLRFMFAARRSVCIFVYSVCFMRMNFTVHCGANTAGVVSFWLTLPAGVDLPSDAMMLWKWGDGNQTDAVPLPFSDTPATFTMDYQYSSDGDFVVELLIFNLASSVTFTVSVCLSVGSKSMVFIFSVIRLCIPPVFL